MEIRITPDKNGTFSVQAFRNGAEVDSYTDVDADEVQTIIGTIKQDNFTIQDWVEEILPDMSYSRSELSYTNDELAIIWQYYFHRHAGGIKIEEHEDSIKFEYTIGKNADPSYAEVLANLFRDALDTEQYGHDVNDIDGFGNWTFANDYDENKVSISQAIDDWTAGWSIWEKLQKLFTKEEIENIKHAYSEGRYE